MEPLSALLRADQHGEGLGLCAPRVGVFEARVVLLDLVRPGSTLGILRVIGRRFLVVAPSAVEGVVLELNVCGPAPVEYGQLLFRIGASLPLGAEKGAIAAPHLSAPSSATHGTIELRAPIHGIFYRRPSTSAPPFVAAGDRVRSGQTLGLIEVMKTFNPILYGGSGMPDEACVRSVEVGDQSEVESGQLLFVLDPAS